MSEVVKRNGKREAFSEKKVRQSIEKAAKEAGIKTDRTREIVADASREALELGRTSPATSTQSIREKILVRLDAIEPSVSSAWRAYDAKRKK